MQVRKFQYSLRPSNQDDITKDYDRDKYNNPPRSPLLSRILAKSSRGKSGLPYSDTRLLRGILGDKDGRDRMIRYMRGREREKEKRFNENESVSGYSIRNNNINYNTSNNIRNKNHFNIAYHKSTNIKNIDYYYEEEQPKNEQITTSNIDAYYAEIEDIKHTRTPTKGEDMSNCIKKENTYYGISGNKDIVLKHIRFGVLEKDKGEQFIILSNSPKKPYTKPSLQPIIYSSFDTLKKGNFFFCFEKKKNTKKNKKINSESFNIFGICNNNNKNNIQSKVCEYSFEGEEKVDNKDNKENTVNPIVIEKLKQRPNIRINIKDNSDDILRSPRNIEEEILTVEVENIKDEDNIKFREVKNINDNKKSIKNENLIKEEKIEIIEKPQNLNDLVELEKNKKLQNSEKPEISQKPTNLQENTDNSTSTKTGKSSGVRERMNRALGRAKKMAEENKKVVKSSHISELAGMLGERLNQVKHQQPKTEETNTNKKEYTIEDLIINNPISSIEKKKPKRKKFVE